MPERNSGSMSCPLGRVTQTASNEEDRLAMRAKYWEKSGVLVITPDDLLDDFDKQWAANMAQRIFGKKART